MPRHSSFQRKDVIMARLKSKKNEDLVAIVGGLENKFPAFMRRLVSTFFALSLCSLRGLLIGASHLVHASRKFVTDEVSKTGYFDDRI